MSTNQIEKEARRLCTHTVCYTTIEQQLVAVRAMLGRSTKAIAKELGITESQAQYRIIKAQKSLSTAKKPRYFRNEYRNGQSDLVKKMLKASERIALQVVREEIAPQFVNLAAPGVPRVP